MKDPDHKNKIHKVQADLIARGPGLWNELLADPDLLQKVLRQLGLELRWKKQPDILTPQEEQVVQEFYPEVKNVLNYLKFLRRSRSDLNSQDKLRDKCADYIKENQDLFRYLTKEHAKIIVELFENQSSKPDRFFYSNLIHVMVKDILHKDIKPTNLYKLVQSRHIYKMSD